ncbi:MAG: protein kinase [Gemmatimonadetes bacterium]|nr:protein kinase [Gemmatimonadota bacterium]
MAAILVVDDEAGIREFMLESLATQGHEIAQAASGAEALDLLRARPFDVMFTDLKMPGALDGIHLLREARRDWPDLKVIVLTAYGTVGTAVEAMKLGAHDYLEKPISGPTELRILVSRALEARGQVPGNASLNGDPVKGLALEVGRALGPDYQVQDPIGQGGYAVVFRVRDRNLERWLAVKVLRPELGAVEEIAERFRCEARTAARLFHPNIVPVYFVGRERDVPFLVMPLVAGESLSAAVRRRGPFPLPEAMRVARDVADALDFAHQAGVIHRDVKPDNILLESATGRSLLSDFGIARAVAHGSRETGPGVVLGTPHYVSPEQAAGEPELGPRSDVYSLGVVVYEMLAGRPPFDGPTARSILTQQVTAAPPPIGGRAGLNGRIENVIRKALAKDPAERFSSAGELVRTLAEAAADGPHQRRAWAAAAQAG